MHTRALFLSTIAPLVLAGTNEFGRQVLAKKAAEGVRDVCVIREA